MPESVKEINVGLLAYGAIGDEHSRAITAVNGLRLTAVADTNPDRLSAAKDLAPDITTFTDSLQMLDSGSLDLVVISTPPNSHYLWAKESLNRGINVILEKPMALSVAHCDELMALAASKNLLLVVYQNRRFDADFITIKKLIDEGVIGESFPMRVLLADTPSHVHFGIQMHRSLVALFLIGAATSLIRFWQ